jgi:hypothetical protein
MNDYKNLMVDEVEKTYEDISDTDGKNSLKQIYSTLMKIQLAKNGLNFSNLYDQKVANVTDHQMPKTLYVKRI